MWLPLAIYAVLDMVKSLTMNEPATPAPVPDTAPATAMEVMAAAAGAPTNGSAIWFGSLVRSALTEIAPWASAVPLI